MIKALIIDDEKPARELIKAYASTIENLEIMGECDNGFDGFKKITELQPDLIFLDVQMPKLTGFEMLELLDKAPAVIFSTAYDNHALQAFEKNAVDYLLKPYNKDRFQQAFEKAKDQIRSAEALPATKLADTYRTVQAEKMNRIAVRQGGKINILPIDDILYFEAQDDYVSVHSSQGKFLKQMTMKSVENGISANDFVRIHRSFLVAVRAIQKLEPYEKDSYVVVLNNQERLSVSRSGYSKLREVLGI